MMHIVKQNNCYIEEAEKAYREGCRLYIIGGVAEHACCIKRFS